GPGKHGSTLGGNAICAAVSRTIFDVIDRQRLVERAAGLGELAMGRLRNESSVRDKVAGVRGRSLRIGVELKDAPEKFAEKGLERGVVVNLTAKKVVRLAPPINIDEADWNRGIDALVA